ncbi:hypothetical protein [Flavobacterium nackdongense]|uniref:Signal peptidase n=1 Tax=Flavobacterium nackdongense TaxID=2547394 RepID=A0A4V1AH28_9FLAO|nr:hypothetical protein [Flavobacterium nackdongense]QBN20092.1 hypothetical protein E1750_15230 [Flavobacterium nackdongense]
MKNKFLKYCIALFFIGSTTIAFAQPGTGSDNNGIDDNGGADSTPATPIDDYVGILTLVGLSYVLYKVKTNQKEEKAI